MDTIVGIFTFQTVFVISLCYGSSTSKECDLSALQNCVGDATDLVPRIYFNPVNKDLLEDIKENYCGKGIEQCLQTDHGNCTSNLLASYQTVINTVDTICRTEIEKSSCFARADVQHTCGFCFQVFKVVVDNVVSDPSLSTDEINIGLCNAHSDVMSCCMEAAVATCSSRDQAYIATLLSATTRANRAALKC